MPTDRDLTDAYDASTLYALWVTNRRLYGRRKLWKSARRAGHDWGRDRVEPLMGIAGISGVRGAADGLSPQSRIRGHRGPGPHTAALELPQPAGAVVGGRLHLCVDHSRVLLCVFHHRCVLTGHPGMESVYQ